MTAYNVFIIDTDASRRMGLKDLIEKYCPYLNVVGEYQHLYKAFIESEIKNPNIIFIETSFFSDEHKLVFEEMEMDNVVFVFIKRDNEQVAVWEAISYPYTIEVTLAEINAIVKKKRLQLDRVQLAQSNAIYIKNVGKDFLTVSTLDRIEIIRMEEIMFCKADGKYTSFYLRSGSTVVSSKNIGEFELSLQKNRFYRIHQTYIVNIEFVKRILKKEGCFCELENGMVFPIALRRQEGFYKYLSIK